MKKLVTLLLLLVGSVAFAQNLNIDIDAEYYIPKTNTFLVKKDGGYTSHYLWVEFDNQLGYRTRLSESKPESLEYILKQHRITKEELLPVNSLSKNKTPDILSKLENIEFTYPTVSRAQWQHYYVLNFSGNYAIQRYYTHDTSRPEMPEPVPSFHEIVPVTINKSRTLLYFFHNKQLMGYLVPKKDGQHYLRLININEMPKQGIATNSLKRTLRMYYPEGEIFTARDRYGIRQKNDARIIVPAEYDSVKTLPGLIVAYTATVPKLFHRNGDTLAMPGLRAVKTGHFNTVTALVGNDVYYIDTEGKLLDTVARIDRWGCGTVPHYTESIAVEDGYYVFRHLYQYGETRETKHTLVAASKYKSLVFIDGSSKRHYTSNDEVYNQFPKHCFIAETADGKSIVQIDYTRENSVPATLLPFDGYTFSFKNFGYPVKFSKDGLSGFFPQNKTVRYVALKDFDKGFARFKMPDGKMGWLHFDGTEYIDE